MPTLVRIVLAGLLASTAALRGSALSGSSPAFAQNGFGDELPLDAKDGLRGVRSASAGRPRGSLLLWRTNGDRDIFVGGLCKLRKALT